MTDIFEKQRMYQQARSSNQPNFRWATGYDEGKDIRNKSYQNQIDRIVATVNETNDESIDKVSQRLNNLNKNYNKGDNWNEETILLFDESLNTLKQFKEENASFKTGYSELLAIDDDIKNRMLGTHDDPKQNILAMPQEEFEKAVKENATEYLENLHEQQNLFLEFESKHSKRLAGSPNIRQSLVSTMDNLYFWKGAIESELQSVLGLKPEEFQNILDNPQVYKEYKGQKIKELDSTRRGLEQKMNTVNTNFQKYYSFVMNRNTPEELPTAGGGKETIMRTLNLEDENDKNIFDNYKRELYKLSNEGLKLNSQWNSSWWTKPEQPFYIDFNVNLEPKKKSIEDVVKEINSNPIAKKQFESDPKSYIESNNLPKGSEFDIAQSLGLAPDFASIAKQEAVGDIVMASDNKKEEVVEEEEEVVQYDKEEGFTPAANEYDINAIQKELKKGENVVYINSKNSSDISLEPKKGYNKNTLTKKEIVRRMRTFNKSLRSVNNITLNNAMNEVRNTILKDPDIRKAIQGNKSTIGKAIAEEVKEFNNQNPDMSFSEWLGKKYNVSQNLTQTK